jgi:hypothetical protein
MRLTIFLACFALSLSAASHADAKEGPWPLGGAWPAPAGHFQPRARDMSFGPSAFPSQTEALDPAFDEKLKICRGC